MGGIGDNTHISVMKGLTNIRSFEHARNVTVLDATLITVYKLTAWRNLREKGSTFWPDENLVGDISAKHKIQWGCISFGIVCGNDMVDFIISTTAYALLS